MARRPPPHWPIVTATAHRPEKIAHDARRWAWDKIDACVRWLYDECGTRTFICGMARGGDLRFGAAAVKAGMSLWCYLPCEEQTKPWIDPGEIAEWWRLRQAGDKSHERIVADRYSAAAMYQRNEWMLQDADAVICLWDPAQRDHSGTFGAVRRAHDLRLPGMHIDPSVKAVRWGLPTI